MDILEWILVALATTGIVLLLVLVLMVSISKAFSSYYKDVEAANTWHFVGLKLNIATSVIAATLSGVAIFFLAYQNFELTKIKNFERYKDHRTEFYEVLDAIPKERHTYFSFKFINIRELYYLVFHNNLAGDFEITPSALLKKNNTSQPPENDKQQPRIYELIYEVKELNNTLEELKKAALSGSGNGIAYYELGEKTDYLLKKITHKLQFKVFKTAISPPQKAKQADTKDDISFTSYQVRNKLNYQQILTYNSTPPGSTPPPYNQFEQLSDHINTIFRIYNTIIRFTKSNLEAYEEQDYTALLQYTLYHAHIEADPENKEFESVRKALDRIYLFLIAHPNVMYKKAPLCSKLSMVLEPSYEEWVEHNKSYATLFLDELWNYHMEITIDIPFYEYQHNTDLKKQLTDLNTLMTSITDEISALKIK